MCSGLTASGHQAEVSACMRPRQGFVVHAASEGHEWVSGLDTAKGCVDLYGLCSHLSTCGPLWTLPTMLTLDDAMDSEADGQIPRKLASHPHLPMKQVAAYKQEGRAGPALQHPTALKRRWWSRMWVPESCPSPPQGSPLLMVSGFDAGRKTQGP